MAQSMWQPRMTPRVVSQNAMQSGSVNDVQTPGLGLGLGAGGPAPANPPGGSGNKLSTHGMGMNEQSPSYTGPVDDVVVQGQVIPAGTGGMEPQPSYLVGVPLGAGGPAPAVLPGNGQATNAGMNGVAPTDPPVWQGGGSQPGGFRPPTRTNFWQQITQLAKPSVTTAPASAQRQQQLSNAARNRAAFLSGFNGVRRGFQ